jgi:hypothetical protein
MIIDNIKCICSKCNSIQKFKTVISYNSLTPKKDFPINICVNCGCELNKNNIIGRIKSEGIVGQNGKEY